MAAIRRAEATWSGALATGAGAGFRDLVRCLL